MSALEQHTNHPPVSPLVVPMDGSRLLMPSQPHHTTSRTCLCKHKLTPTCLPSYIHRLADNKTLREELAAFPLGVGVEGGVSGEQRPSLLPLLTRLLFPKLRKRR